MAELTIIHILMGATLGLRFKVLVLIPVVIAIISGTAAVAVAHADPFWSVVVSMILLGTAVQFGYLAGILSRA